MSRGGTSKADGYIPILEQCGLISPQHSLSPTPHSGSALDPKLPLVTTVKLGQFPCQLLLCRPQGGGRQIRGTLFITAFAIPSPKPSSDELRTSLFPAGLDSRSELEKNHFLLSFSLSYPQSLLPVSSP